MKRLLSIEWLKIAYYRTGWIFIVLYFLILIFMAFMIPQLKPSFNGQPIAVDGLGAYNFPNVWQNVTYFAAIAKIFLAIIIVTHITNEYSNRTLKQNLIDGLSKKEFLASKSITMVLLSLLSTVIVMLIAIYFGTVYGDADTGSIWHGSDFIGAYFLKLLCFFSFVMLLAFLARNSAFALLMLFVWWVIEALLSWGEMMIKLRVFKMQSPEDSIMISDFLPLNASSALIPLPSLNMENLMKGLPIFVEQQVAWEPVVCTLLYTALFIYLSYLLLLKRNL